jgi:hypothetical protein
VRQLIEAPYVAGNTKGINAVGTQSSNGLLQRWDLDITDYDPCTPKAELPGCGEADSASSTGYYRSMTRYCVHRRTVHSIPNWRGLFDLAPAIGWTNVLYECKRCSRDQLVSWQSGGRA